MPTTFPSSTSTLRLGLDMLARLHRVRRTCLGAEGHDEARDALIAWLDSLGSPIADALRQASNERPRRNLLAHLLGGYMDVEEEHWRRLDARGILLRSVTLFVDASIDNALGIALSPDLVLYPVELVGELSEPSVEEPHWLALAPVVATLLDKLAHKKEDAVDACFYIGRDLLCWAYLRGRIDELLDEVARVRRTRNDRLLRSEAGLYVQLASDSELHR